MIYVVRHGKTDWNKEHKTMGRIDIPLNEEGRKQAYITSEKIGDANIDLIICSPLERAKETARIINTERKLPMLFDDRIMERSLGDLEGKSYTPDNDRLWDININTDEYNVETMEKFKERVYGFIEYLLHEYEDKDILVVTHGGVSALINCYFNGTLKQGPISDKFLGNCEVANYKTYKDYVLKIK